MEEEELRTSLLSKPICLMHLAEINFWKQDLYGGGG